MVLGGFCVLGDSILSPIESRELKEIEEKLEKERKGLYDYSGRGSKVASAELWMKKFMKSGSKLEHLAFLVFWLSRHVFHGSRDSVNKAVFSVAIHLDRGIRIALAPAVLAHIYGDLSLLKRTIVASNGSNELKLESPFHLLQVWAWERFLELRPKPNVMSYAEPRLARWDRIHGQDFGNLRIVLDSAGECFMWRPYAIAIENWKLPSYCSEKDRCVGSGLDDEFLSFALCLRVTDLVGFGRNERYLPHRVARQFGYDQDIPCVIAQFNDGSGIFIPHISWKYHMKEIKDVKLYIPSRLSEADVSTRYMKWWEETVSGLKHITKPRMPPKKKAKTTEGSLLTGKPALRHPGFRRTKVAEGSNERNRFTGFTIPSVSCPKSYAKVVKISKVHNVGNNSLVPPGFPPRFPPTGNMMEVGDTMDKDEPTSPEILEKGKQKNVETRKGVDDSIADGSSVDDIMKSERLEKEVMLSPTLVWGSKAKRNIKYVIVSNARSLDNDMVRTIGNEWASRVERQVSELKNLVRNFKESDILKYCKHKNIETRRDGDCVKLSGEVQDLASSTVEEGSVMKQVSELKARVSKLESLADMFQTNTSGAGEACSSTIS
ncbi:uncharacterized protein LOC121049118 isoform X1 [Rosa chinensis]|uniref:uncharacterized protein LOC121049118 isoform X1 n=1 Tax=Rosa chinensis TaxID=74649 RepID=UPI001AD91D30|nr:uncharacterized protein LOC121049118 isoform X1 [Rosa chinensis]